jgi:hypothetical protein
MILRCRGTLAPGPGNVASSDSTSCLSRPALPRRQWRVVGWVDILLDVIGGVESVLREGCPRTTTGVSQRWFLVHFRQVVFNTIALPCINIGANVWGESSIMTGVYQRWCSTTLHIGWGLCDLVCQVLVCRGRYGLAGGGLLFILELKPLLAYSSHHPLLPPLQRPLTGPTFPYH